MKEKEKQDRSNLFDSDNVVVGTSSPVSTDLPEGIEIHGRVILHNSKPMQNFHGREFDIIEF